MSNDNTETDDSEERSASLKERIAKGDYEVSKSQAKHDTLYSNPEYADAYKEAKEQGIQNPHEYASEVTGSEETQQNEVETSSCEDSTLTQTSISDLVDEDD